MKFLLKLIFIFFLSTKLFAVTDTESLSQLLLNIRSMQANFIETVKDKSAKSIRTTQGTIALQRPGKFRWEVKQPNPQLIIINDTRLWIYDPDLEQVTVRSFDKNKAETPAFLLSDKDLSLVKDFNVERGNTISQIANQQTFILTPKNKDNLFSHIKITFMKNMITQMQLEDHLGHVTTLTFQKIKTNVNFDPAFFQFKPSAKVDVIDETKNQRF